MMPPRLEELEKKLRGAAASRKYAEVREVALELDEAARAHLQTLPKNDPQVPELARYLADLLSWALVMTQAGRSACAAELRRVSFVHSYSHPCGEVRETPAVRLDA